MPGFSKQTKEFIENTGDDAAAPKFLAPIPPSANRMIPGDIIVFRYYSGVGPGSRGQRVILVIKTKAGDGVYISGKGNTLVTCFKLDGDSDAVISIIMDNLYKKRRRASYYGKIKESLISLLGIDSFRTYNLNNMKQLYKVYL